MASQTTDEVKQCCDATPSYSDQLFKTMRSHMHCSTQSASSAGGGPYPIQETHRVSTLAVLGGGGHGKVVADAAQASGNWEQIVFFDDAWPRLTENGAWPVAGDFHALFRLPRESCEVIVAIGDNQLRSRIIEHLREQDFRLATVVHPCSCISRHAHIGPGTVVFAGAVVNIGARVGPACIINTRATIDHDCVLGTAVHVSPGANLAGEVQIGDCSWIGIGACVRQQIILGSNVMIGAGAVVVSSFPDNVVAVGVPARIMKGRSGC